MKKSISAILIIFLFSGCVFAQKPELTEYERKLKYKRSKIEIVVRTSIVGKKSGYSDTDSYSYTVEKSEKTDEKSMEKTNDKDGNDKERSKEKSKDQTSENVSVTRSGSQTKTGETIKYERVTDWVVVKGGLRELSEIEFLELVGDNETLMMIRRKEEEGSGWRATGLTTFLVGIAAIVGGAAAEPINSGLVAAGSILTLGGLIIGSFGSVRPRHYIYADYAQELVDEYNIKLKRSLNLPIDYE